MPVRHGSTLTTCTAETESEVDDAIAEAKGLIQLRRQLRNKCNAALKRLYPEDGSSAVADWNFEDVLEIMAIFEVDRVARPADHETERLNRMTVLRVLAKLGMQAPFYDHCQTSSLIELEQHLRLLAAALRLYKLHGTALEFSLHAALYQGINKLSDLFDTSRKHRQPQFMIEEWNVAFLLQHCQYLLTSINHSQTLVKNVGNRIMLAMGGVLSGYGNQFVDASMYAKELAKRQRSRPKWHDMYIHFGDLCWNIIAMDVGVETAEQRPDTEKQEKETALDFRDGFEDLLSKESSSWYNIAGAVHKLVGKTTKLAQDAGPYEENAEYLKYGMLDLLYHLSFRINNRQVCLEQFVWIIKTVLLLAHPSAAVLHRKAFDLYNRINELGNEDHVVYGSLEDRAVIDQWGTAHIGKSETVEDSARRSKRFTEEVRKIRKTEVSLLKTENGVRLPVLPSVPLGDPSRQSTMATIVVTSEETRVPNVPLVAEPEQMEEPSQLEPISIDDEIAQLDALEDYLEKATTRRTSTAISAPPNTEHLIEPTDVPSLRIIASSTASTVSVAPSLMSSGHRHSTSGSSESRHSTIRPNRKSSSFSHATLADKQGPFNLLTGPNNIRRTKEIPISTALSSSGSTAATLMPHEFWIFNTMSATLKCAGIFEKKGMLAKERTFKYAVGNDVFVMQRPPRIGKVSAFTCIALSDKYVAIGCNGRVQVFIIDGKFAGRWVYSDDISNGVINKLCFSPDGRQLVALLVYGDNNIEEARIYPADRFPNGDLERTEVAGVNLLKPVPVPWEHDFIHNPSGIAFSSNGNMVAFCTSHSNRKAKIRILKKEEATWRHWGSQEIVIFGTDHHDWTGGGFTGISFVQNDEYLVLSVDSTNTHAPDRFRIVPERTRFRLDKRGQIALKQGGTKNIAIASSSEFNAIAILSRDGQLQIKPDGQQLGGLSLKKNGNVQSAPEAVTISFSDTGQTLFFLDNHGILEYYNFHHGALGVQSLL